MTTDILSISCILNDVLVVISLRREPAEHGPLDSARYNWLRDKSSLWNSALNSKTPPVVANLYRKQTYIQRRGCLRIGKSMAEDNCSRYFAANHSSLAANPKIYPATDNRALAGHLAGRVGENCDRDIIAVDQG
jgi:hypothetical protein